MSHDPPTGAGHFVQKGIGYAHTLCRGVEAAPLEASSPVLSPDG